MKIVCKQTTSRGFDLKEVTTVLSNEFDYGYGGYGLKLGTEYLAMGLAIYRSSNCVYYLVDVNGRPDWFPYLLFDVTDSALPVGWFVTIHDQKNQDGNIRLLCGFEELCHDPGFYGRLLDREEQALRVYFRRKVALA